MPTYSVSYSCHSGFIFLAVYLRERNGIFGITVNVSYVAELHKNGTNQQLRIQDSINGVLNGQIL